MTRLDARLKKTSSVRNKSNQLKLDTNEQLMNRMHKLRKKLYNKIRSMPSISLAATESGFVSKQNVIYVNLSIKV